MAIKPSTPKSQAKHVPSDQDRNPGDILDAVLDELRALRQGVDALRDEVRAISDRRSPGRERRGRDPGDSVPPGVGVESPAPLSAAERRVRRSLKRLSPG